MRIDVLGDESISKQARIYAEYRLFAALPYVMDTTRVPAARVVLRQIDHDRKCPAVSCAVVIELDTGESFNLAAMGDHPYAAINRMIEQLKNDPPRFEGALMSEPSDAAR